MVTLVGWMDSRRRSTRSARLRTTQLFTAIIERETDAFVALCPELDIASQGETVEAARANLREAVELFFESADPSEVGLTHTASSAEAAERGLRDAAARLYREALAECQAAQDLYDRETRHGNHRSAQGRWTTQLASELAGSSGSAVASAD